MIKYIYKLVSFISIYSIFIISQNFTSLTYADGITYADKITYENEKQITSEVNIYSLFSQKLIEKINKDADNLGIKWVKGGMQSFSEYNFSGFIVLNETLKKLSFLQGNFTYDSNNGKTLNIGLGHRTLVDVSPEFKDFVGGKEAMLEINTFYDLKSSQDGLLSSSNLFSSPHSRHSLGLRLSTPKYDFYGNLYQRGQNTFINDERVLSGHDFGFSGRIPKDDNLKFNLKRYNFSSDFNRKSGVKLRAEYFLTPHISFGGEYDNSDQNNSSEELFLNFKYNFGEKLNQRVNTTPSATKVWDKRYDEVIRENKVYLEKRLVITSITAPSLSGTLGGTVDVALASSTGYDSNTMGEVTYTINSADNVTGASISGSNLVLTNATITPAASSATIQIRATIAANDQYAETTINYNVAVNRQSAPSLSFATPDAVAWGTPVPAEAPTPSSNYNATEMGALVYSGSADGINVASNGTVTATQPGSVTVTVSTTGTSTKYETGTVGSYDVTFNKKNALDLSFATPDAVAWGTPVPAEAPTPSSNYNATEMGALVYSGSADGINVASNGTVTATQPGSVTVTVSTSGTGTKYNSGNVGTYTVTFNKKPALGLSFATPDAVAWGTTVPAEAPTPSSNYNATEMGALVYSGSADGINVASNGTVTATQPGSVTVTVSTSGTGTKYNSGNVGTYTVTFNSVANPYGSLGSSLRGNNLTIADTSRYTLPTTSNLKLSSNSANGSSEVAYNATEMGALSFEVDNNGGITGITTGSFTGTQLGANPASTGAGNSGTIKIKLKLEGGTKYNAKEFTYDVIYQ